MVRIVGRVVWPAKGGRFVRRGRVWLRVLRRQRRFVWEVVRIRKTTHCIAVRVGKGVRGGSIVKRERVVVPKDRAFAMGRVWI